MSPDPTASSVGEDVDASPTAANAPPSRARPQSHAPTPPRTGSPTKSRSMSVSIPRPVSGADYPDIIPNLLTKRLSLTPDVDPAESSATSASTSATSAMANSPDSDKEAMKQLRWLRVLTKRHDRLMVHLENYIRLEVVVDRPSVTFTVVCDKRHKVDYLVHQIEAEYAYRYLMPEKMDPNGTIPHQRNEEPVLPLECGLLLDSGMVSLKYDNTIGEVLDVDSTIYAMNVFEALSASSDPAAAGSVVNPQKPQVDEETPSPLVTAFKRNSIVAMKTKSQRTSMKPPEPSNNGIRAVDESANELEADRPLEKAEEECSQDAETEKASPSSEFSAYFAQLQAPQDQAHDSSSSERNFPATRASFNGSATTNPNRLSVASNFTVQTTQTTPSMADPHPPLDDRLQRLLRNKIGLQLFAEFCVEDYTVENLLFWLDAETFQSCPPGDRVQFGKYVYAMYITDGAPLKVNLSAEVLRDVRVPVGGVETDLMAFDEAQQCVYTVLRAHAFVRFEKSDKGAQYAAIRENRVEYRKSRIHDSYFNALQPTVYKTIASTFQRPFGPNPSDTADRNNLLNALLKSYFPNSASLPVSQYFDAPARLNTVQKRRKIRKEKKIAKFFGERPSFEQLQRQLASSNFPSPDSLSLAWTPGAPAPHSHYHQMLGSLDPDDPDYFQTIDEEGEGSSNLLKKKKVEKLTDFFGTSLPKRQLRQQNLAGEGTTSVFSTEEEGEQPEGFMGKVQGMTQFNLLGGNDGEGNADQYGEPLETLNELDSGTKRALTKRTKKLVNLLGDPQAQEYAIKLLKQKLATTEDDVAHSDEEEDDIIEEVDEEEDLEGLELITNPIEAPTLPLESLDSLTDQLLNPRETRRKKLNKLSHFLGEALWTIDAAESTAAKASAASKTMKARGPLTPEEKILQIKRAHKLERVLGTVVPSDLVLVNSNGEGSSVAGPRVEVQGVGLVGSQSPKMPRKVHRGSIGAGSVSGAAGTGAVGTRRERRATWASADSRSHLAMTKGEDSNDGANILKEEDATNDDARQVVLDTAAMEGENEGRTTVDQNVVFENKHLRVDADGSKEDRRTSTASVNYHMDLIRIHHMLEDGKNVDMVLDLMDEMVAFDIEVEGIKKGESLSSLGGTSTDPSANTNTVLTKAARKRKLQKLTKFFGSQLNPVQLLEQSIVADLEKSIEDEIKDPEELELLRKDIGRVREQLQKRSSDLKKGLEERALRDLAASKGKEKGKAKETKQEKKEEKRKLSISRKERGNVEVGF
ncbi:hypothetical protein HDV05_004516 [Chytridiales sp. JEL 0842]|nr:hypothetical protein HDV05_004516 [Chytridiales sp. JEL 0842]